jgi:hypothetical protein
VAKFFTFPNNATICSKLQTCFETPAVAGVTRNAWRNCNNILRDKIAGNLVQATPINTWLRLELRPQKFMG